MGYTCEGGFYFRRFLYWRGLGLGFVDVEVGLLVRIFFVFFLWGGSWRRLDG